MMKTNRQLKFRVWDKKQNKFERPFNFYDIGTWSHDIYFGLGTKDEYIVQQFTGLQDKNGKDIYEGDIIKFNIEQGETIIREVIFNYGYFAYERVKPGYKGAILMGINATCEVIGNINQNPELLK